jgi:RNA polymerase sigma-70 factor (ECF subfamily)
LTDGFQAGISLPNIDAEFHLDHGRLVCFLSFVACCFSMSARSRHELTRLLQAWCEGDQKALDEFSPLVFVELKRLARRHLLAESDRTLETGELVNEVYLRLLDWKNVQWQNRAHFFAVAAQMMRRILVDYARSRGYQKRGGGVRTVALEENAIVSKDRAREFLALDEALNRLANIDQRKSRVVELRFFGGLSVEETAVVLSVSPITVMRDWEFARSWLERELSRQNE